MKIFEDKLTIESLIKYAETEKIWVPEFQRPFVWDNNQIRLLIDSLYHDYTISSILLWEGEAELARRRLGGSINDIMIPEENAHDEVIYLLDGQQRTTSLLLSFSNKDVYKGNNIRKRTKVDLFWDSEYTGEDPEMRWIFSDETVATSSKEDHIYLDQLSQIELFDKYKSRFVKLKHAYQWTEIGQSILNDMRGDAQLYVSYNAKIANLQKNILFRPVNDIEQKGKLEQVLEVFERINTRNTRLSVLDIMVAKTYKKIGDRYFDLRTYLLLMNHTGNLKKDYFKNFDENAVDVEGIKTKIDNGDMLSLITIMLKQEYLQSSVLKLKTDELIENSRFIHNAFHQLLSVMGQHFCIEESEISKYRPMLKFLAGYHSHFKVITVEGQDFLNKWFWNTLLKNRYPGAQSERIAKDLKLVKNNEFATALNLMIEDNTRSFLNIKNSSKDDPQYFDCHKSNSSQQIYRAMLLLLKTKDAKDFYNGLIPFKEAPMRYKLEEHHIFPLNSTVGREINISYKSHRYNDIINNIANISLLTKDTNNKKIKAKNPSKYILEIESEYKKINKLDDFHAIMNSQFISTHMIQMLKEDNFESFIFARTQLLLNQIESLCEA